MTEMLAFARVRLYEIVDFLGKWGYTVVPHPDDETWAEAIRAAPLTGRLEVTAERWVDKFKLTFKVTEVWEVGDLGDDAAIVREGASLVLYHFHGQTEDTSIRWCLFPAGHSDQPYHIHPWGAPAGKIARHDPVSAEAALALFETEVAINVFGQTDEDE